MSTPPRFSDTLTAPRQPKSAQSTGHPGIHQLYHPLRPLRTSTGRSQQEKGEREGIVVHRLCAW